MNELTKLSYTRLSMSEVESFNTRLLNDLATIPAASITDAPYKAYIVALTTKTSNFQKAILVYLKDQQTEKVKIADQRRDWDTFAFGNFVRVEIHSPVAAEAEAAIALTDLYLSYKGLTTREYTTQTTDTKHLIADLESAKFSKHVATLGAGKYVTRLKDSNNAFETLFGSRSVATAVKVHYDTKALRTDLLACNKEFSEYVLSMANALNTPFFLQALSIINNNRKHFAELLTIASTAKKTEA